MKKSFLAMLLAAFCMTLCACDNGEPSDGSSSEVEVTKTPAEKAAELLDSVEFPEMVEIRGANFEAAFPGISEEQLSEYYIYRCVSGAYPDEFGIIVANDSDTAAAVKDAADAWVEYQTALYRDYTPSEVYKLEDSFVTIVDDVTVIYAICDDNRLAREILE